MNCMYSHARILSGLISFGDYNMAIVLRQPNVVAMTKTGGVAARVLAHMYNVVRVVRAPGMKAPHFGERA